MRQVDGIKRLYTIWPVKYCTKVCVTLFSLTCNLLQEGKISFDEKPLGLKLQIAIYSWMASLKLKVDRFLELISFVKGKVKGLLC